jgi:hypothetical protein
MPTRRSKSVRCPFFGLAADRSALAATLQSISEHAVFSPIKLTIPYENSCCALTKAFLRRHTGAINGIGPAAFDPAEIRATAEQSGSFIVFGTPTNRQGTLAAPHHP